MQAIDLQRPSSPAHDLRSSPPLGGAAQYAAPFTLRSIGTTVLELGAVHRGAWAQRYWSSPGCLFHHAYPVGFRATKFQFGRTYEMRIEAGPTGPVFKVGGGGAACVWLCYTQERGASGDVGWLAAAAAGRARPLTPRPCRPHCPSDTGD